MSRIFSQSLHFENNWFYFDGRAVLLIDDIKPMREFFNNTEEMTALWCFAVPCIWLLSMSFAGQSDPEAKCLSQMEEVYTRALHSAVSWTHYWRTHTIILNTFRHIFVQLGSQNCSPLGLKLNTSSTGWTAMKLETFKVPRGWILLTLVTPPPPPTFPWAKLWLLYAEI